MTTTLAVYLINDMGKFIDLTNKRFGRLTVVSREPNYIQPNGVIVVKWKCRCDCGNITIVKASSLTSNHTKSCGCYQKEKASATGKKSSKQNRYELNEEYGIGYTTNTNKPFLFDLEDYDFIKKYCWSENSSGYITTRFRKKSDSNTKLYRMHRLIMSASPDLKVDHINHNRMDNRKSNLRLCTIAQNNKNRKLDKKSTSGYNGVAFRKDRNKWTARIGFNNKIICLGTFETKDEAIQARIEAERKYYKEFSNLKELKGEK